MPKWLVKTEPSECSIDDFANASGQTIPWDGVRNYQARNFLRQMQVGDQVLVYHSSCKHIGIAGVVKVVEPAYTDPTQFDPDSRYYDSRSAPDQPRWQAVDMAFVSKLPRLLALDSIKLRPGLEGLPLVKKGNRLSVMPVTEDQWAILLADR
ncbi:MULTISPECIES: EVE domain-containing protein [Marinobacter]|uniref:EVE domain-containing protein n=1 Tax=Marinobacter TaxID=2742 RepID=UPI002003E5C9|nr:MULTISPECIES: EVE domain-containing protein [Marinobacter]MCK7551099.1 EVE domain-containing protein [Marinobacter goseongensis]MDV3502636.1 EVE domain-containing protein [Marinobacter sp. M-5]